MESYFNPWSLLQKFMWDPLLRGSHFVFIEYVCQRLKKKSNHVSLQGKNNNYENKFL